jgi:hypothetical protein
VASPLWVTPWCPRHNDTPVPGPPSPQGSGHSATDPSTASEPLHMAVKAGPQPQATGIQG